ncbi:dipeptide ABC transporter ATP-binding protein [Devosia rhodophyticola]|uniref:Dipeptide ABC transporter ATP-binding protein n=1 Tax=Devosia rhodophyticola TaxID=3026423 RepID=A0ABY7YUD9_9HYPH|nr:dipeptide ABC transporter ATP-binding protein [Devosia rhodophyticola]WDR04797.1 dipeptide ABC transporter ATP-binding protein [Devosia rhodophyticola]
MEASSQETGNEPLLVVNDLKKYYPVNGGWFKPPSELKALDGISFTLERGETLGLVGESGCGKTTLGRCILRAIEPSGGKIEFLNGRTYMDILKLDTKSLRDLRAQMQMVFQDPYGSLDPRMTVFDIIAEPLTTKSRISGKKLTERVAELMEMVGLEVKFLNRYPHAFSGGQRQRIGIARALATNPELVVCDEAVSALDVSVQAQILNLLKDLQQELGITYLFISHNLSVVRHISDRIAVMYLGRLVELAESDQMFEKPMHPYTEMLLSAIPSPDPDVKRQAAVDGEVPNPANVPPGCAFCDRCKYAIPKCRTERPELRALQNNHLAACHRAEELSLVGAV